MAVSPTDRIAGRRGEYGPFALASAPVAGTSEVQTISSAGTPTGGTFKLKFRGVRTAAIAFNATAAAIVAALEALETIGTGGVTATGGALPTAVVVTFAGVHAKEAVPTLAVVESALTGGANPAITVAETTPGVSASLRGAPKGAIAIAQDTGKPYSNTGTSSVPVWVLTATLST